MKTWFPARPARLLLATTALLSGSAATLTAQTDLFQATAIAHAATADHDVEDTGTLAACVGVVWPGQSDVRNPTRRVLDLAEGMLDQQPAPWRPGDSVAVANLTPASRCERMRERRDRLAEAAGREYSPVRFILVEVEGPGPRREPEITVRYRGDAEGELRCSAGRRLGGTGYGCAAGDLRGGAPVVRALRAHPLHSPDHARPPAP